MGEALGPLLPVGRVEAVHFDVPLLPLHALAVDDLDLELAGVVGPHPVSDDHVAQLDLAPAAGAHAAHRQAADVEVSEDRRRGADSLDAAHPVRLGDRDPQLASFNGEAANADLGPAGRRALLPRALRHRARIDREHGVPLVLHGGDDEHVDALAVPLFLAHGRLWCACCPCSVNDTLAEARGPRVQRASTSRFAPTATLGMGIGRRAAPSAGSPEGSGGGYIVAYGPEPRTGLGARRRGR